MSERSCLLTQLQLQLLRRMGVIFKRQTATGTRKPASCTRASFAKPRPPQLPVGKPTPTNPHFISAAAPAAAA
eukprot:353765-Chlamydomonas_euryale.AAC.4